MLKLIGIFSVLLFLLPYTQVIADYWSNFHFQQGVPLFNEFIRGGPLHSNLQNLHQETRSIALLYSVKCVSITVLTTSVTDRQTDRHTDRTVFCNSMVYHHHTYPENILLTKSTSWCLHHRHRAIVKHGYNLYFYSGTM